MITIFSMVGKNFYQAMQHNRCKRPGLHKAEPTLNPGFLGVHNPIFLTSSIFLKRPQWQAALGGV